MGPLQDAFNKVLEKVPHRAFQEVIADKLRSAGIDNNELAGRITDHLIAGSDSFVWDDGPDLDLTFDDGDLAEVEKRLRKITGSIGEMLGDLTKQLGDNVLEGIRGQWARSAPSANKEFTEFKERLEKRWSDGLVGLRILLELNRDQGAYFHEKNVRSRYKTNRVRNKALTQLHVRGCQVAAEIILLLENGYPKGAMARWRTLFEITTVATLWRKGTLPMKSSIRKSRWRNTSAVLPI
jgi:hypothetical protein